MQYIPCTRCGHLNTVKSVNILFCEQCNKRLQNNFIDWYKAHPDKTFEDFSKIYCLTDYDIAVKSLPEVKKTKTTLIAGVAVILILLVGLGSYFGYRKLAAKMPVNTDIPGNWMKSDIGNSGLILDLPFELIKQPVGKEERLYIECYSTTSGSGFKIITFYKIYNGTELPDPEKIAQDKISEIQKIEGIKELKWNRSDTLIGNRKGINLSLRYTLAEYRIFLNSIIVCDRKYVWQVTTQYTEDDEDGRNLSDRILASIVIKS